MSKYTFYTLGLGVILGLGIFFGVTGCEKPQAPANNTILNTGN